MYALGRRSVGVELVTRFGHAQRHLQFEPAVGERSTQQLLRLRDAVLHGVLVHAQPLGRPRPTHSFVEEGDQRGAQPLTAFTGRPKFSELAADELPYGGEVAGQ